MGKNLGDEAACAFLKLLEMPLPLEALRIDLIHILGARRPCCKPPSLCGHLDPADGRTVGRGFVQDLDNRVTGKILLGDDAGRKLSEYTLLRLGTWTSIRS